MKSCFSKGIDYIVFCISPRSTRLTLLNHKGLISRMWLFVILLSKHCALLSERKSEQKIKLWKNSRWARRRNRRTNFNQSFLTCYKLDCSHQNQTQISMWERPPMSIKMFTLNCGQQNSSDILNEVTYKNYEEERKVK